MIYIEIVLTSSDWGVPSHQEILGVNWTDFMYVYITVKTESSKEDVCDKVFTTFVIVTVKTFHNDQLNHNIYF